MRHAFLVLLAVLLAAWGVVSAHAQEREQIQIGLSTEYISVTADFSGADLTIFGAVANLDPLIQRQGRYDVVVTLAGPDKPLTLRRKGRFLGMWINADSLDFAAPPQSYSLASTRALRDVTDQKTLGQLALGVDHLPLRLAANEADIDPKRKSEFSDAFRSLKRERGLYDERIGDVEFLTSNLFRATLSLPANVPIGVHKARAYLFKSGKFVGETNTQLEIRKAGLEQAVFDFARERSFLYGLIAVAIAIFTGWLGRLVFQRD